MRFRIAADLRHAGTMLMITLLGKYSVSACESRAATTGHPSRTVRRAGPSCSSECHQPPFTGRWNGVIFASVNAALYPVLTGSD